MFILLTYDIELKDEKGSNRLRKVAKICENYVVRVQNSVFELNIDIGQLKLLQNDLIKIIDENDSIRFYKLGNNYKDKMEIIGKNEKIEISKDNCFLI